MPILCILAKSNSEGNCLQQSVWKLPSKPLRTQRQDLRRFSVILLKRNKGRQKVIYSRENSSKNNKRRNQYEDEIQYGSQIWFTANKGMKKCFNKWNDVKIKKTNKNLNHWIKN